MYLALGKYFKIFAVYVEGQSDSKGKKKSHSGKKKRKVQKWLHCCRTKRQNQGLLGFIRTFVSSDFQI